MQKILPWTTWSKDSLAYCRRTEAKSYWLFLRILFTIESCNLCPASLFRLLSYSFLSTTRVKIKTQNISKHRRRSSFVCSTYKEENFLTSLLSWKNFEIVGLNCWIWAITVNTLLYCASLIQTLPAKGYKVSFRAFIPEHWLP